MGRRKNFQRRFVSAHLRALRAVKRDRPASFRYWMRVKSWLERAVREPDVLLPPQLEPMTGAVTLRTPLLRRLLADDVLGLWALDADTIEFLWSELSRERPQVIVECGAGSSSLLLASYAASVRDASAPAIISIEQDFEYKLGVEQRLCDNGLDRYVSIIHTPVNADGTYDLDLEAISRQLSGRRIDWIIIDGPSGPDGCRHTVMPELARFCRVGARWFLDDAFRDGEMEILNRWSHLRGVVVHGIYPFNKGMATGVVTDPLAVGGSVSSFVNNQETQPL